MTISELKLGPASTETVTTTYSPTMEELSAMDYSSPDAEDPTLGTPHFVDVTCHGRTERWVLYILPTDKTVSTEACDAWSGVVWLRGSGIAGQAMGFRYRVGTEGEWSEVPDVEIDGGTFSAAFTAEPLTTYQFKSYCGSDESDPTTVTTEGVQQFPNNGLEEWSKPGKPWLPYLSDEAGAADLPPSGPRVTTARRPSATRTTSQPPMRRPSGPAPRERNRPNSQAPTCWESNWPPETSSRESSPPPWARTES